MSGANIDYVCECINHDREKLEKKQFEKIELDSFSLALFWNQFGSAVQAVSNEGTKLGFICGKKPFPAARDLDSMLEALFQHYTSMRDLFLVLPEEVGATVYNATVSVVIRIMDALLTFVQSLRGPSEKRAKEILTFTGSLWDACNAVDSIPKNNVLAVLNVLDIETTLAKDALDEITSEMVAEPVQEQQKPNSPPEPHLLPFLIDSETLEGTPWEKEPSIPFGKKRIIVPEPYIKRLADLERTGWSKTRIRNRKVMVQREDGTIFRIRMAMMRSLVQTPQT